MRARKGRLPFAVLYEDESIIVIDKPHALLSTHTKLFGRAAREAQPTAENLINDYLRKGQLKSKKRVWLVHRLDRETSGVMMMAKSLEASEFYRADWNRLTKKTYLARVKGLIEADEGVFESYLREDDDGYKVRSVTPQPGSHRTIPKGGKPARLAKTSWRKLSAGKTTTLVEVYLHSGRKNQIRVHFAEAGHPVVGDCKYGGGKAPRMLLHALRLRVRHFRTGEWMEFVAPAPQALFSEERT